jgi:hypothetical protein
MTTNSALAWENFSDAGTITASGSLVLTPPSLLQNIHVAKKWRHNATTTFVVADLGALKLIDTVMLAGLSSEIPTFRVRYSTVDPTGAAGNVYDSGVISGLPYFDANYTQFIHLRPTPLSARYIRIDIVETGTLTYIEAGRLAVSGRDTFITNMQTPWSRSSVRGGIDTIGVGGQTFTDVRPGHWSIRANYQFVEETERNDFIETMGLILVEFGRLDMLWIRDADSTNLARDCVWGYLEQDLIATQNEYIDPPLFGVDFPIRQRL